MALLQQEIHSAPVNLAINDFEIHSNRLAPACNSESSAATAKKSI